MADTSRPAIPRAALDRRRKFRRQRDLWGRFYSWLPARMRSVVADCGGFRMRLFPGDNFTETFFFNNGRFPEEASLAFLAGWLSGRRALFLDIGANVGVYSLRIAPMLSEGGRIQAFEPNPILLRRLATNIRLNSFRNIGVFPCALGSETGTQALSIRAARKQNLGEGSLLAHTKQAYSTAVPVRTLLSCMPADATEYDCIAVKIDIEGFEDRVLAPFFQQADPALWPDLILFEIAHAHKWETNVPSLLASLGYTQTQILDQNAVFERKSP